MIGSHYLLDSHQIIYLSVMYLDQLLYQMIRIEGKMMVVCSPLERGVSLKLS